MQETGGGDGGRGKVRLKAGLLAPPSTVHTAHSGLGFAMASFGPCLGLVHSPVARLDIGPDIKQSLNGIRVIEL